MKTAFFTLSQPVDDSLSQFARLDKAVEGCEKGVPKNIVRILNYIEN